MTKDHIFPQGLAVPGQRRVSTILNKFDPKLRGRQGTFLAQNGLMKSTLCAECNNLVLGTQLDPSLIEFYKAVTKALELGHFPMMPALFIGDVSLNRVARAVAGHLIALSDEPCARKSIRMLRRFVLNRDGVLDPTLRFHMWLYPFSKQGAYHDLVHSELGAGFEPLWISAYKTYPFAFAFSTEVHNPNYRIKGVMDITKFLSSNLDQRFNLRISTRPLVGSNWPFAAIKNGVILTGDNASVSTEPYSNKAKART